MPSIQHSSFMRELLNDDNNTDIFDHVWNEFSNEIAAECGCGGHSDDVTDTQSTDATEKEINGCASSLVPSTKSRLIDELLNNDDSDDDFIAAANELIDEFLYGSDDEIDDHYDDQDIPIASIKVKTVKTIEIKLEYPLNSKQKMFQIDTAKSRIVNIAPDHQQQIPYLSIDFDEMKGDNDGNDGKDSNDIQSNLVLLDEEEEKIASNHSNGNDVWQPLQFDPYFSFDSVKSKRAGIIYIDQAITSEAIEQKMFKESFETPQILFYNLKWTSLMQYSDQLLVEYRCNDNDKSIMIFHTDIRNDKDEEIYAVASGNDKRDQSQKW
eukprot:CAMPEP_0201569078 /NCGR_PEP_ID=MMETSP0190_2-20130828/10563_1 /ASSEMBLY_ACC=CAM_ASM_000263 /TAXON_ID=37353 /ORGANISM="Rosalina sp." /LENGTH=323 /DNA_ID=CAMNT_0047991003 /DNA_START=286 /DNA_END=1254 /DNA_ORIENTATION=+